jgi:hypothetical protein
MKLLDAANVNPQDAHAGRWLDGYHGVSRECAVHIEVEDPCPPDWEVPEGNATELVGDVDSRKANYLVRPFPIRSFLRQSVSCQQDDDAAWFQAAVKAHLDYVVSQGLVRQFASDQETWVGDSGVQSVAIGTATAAGRLAAVIAGRKLWFSTVVSRAEAPLLHVPPSLAPELVTSGVLAVNGPEDVHSVWGDKVVISAGYDEATTPHAFFTGEVIVRLGTPSDEGGGVYDRRINNYTLSANQWAAIDLAPCAIVRIGA